MTSVLLVRGAEPGTISLHRSWAGERLVARMRAPGLDRRLAAGESPDNSPLLSLRAQTLIAAPTRRRLAATLQRIVREAQVRAGAFHPAVPLARADILANRALIEELARVLGSRQPLEPRGVARVELLITDGGGPLYAAGPGGGLRSALLAVLESVGAPSAPADV